MTLTDKVFPATTELVPDDTIKCVAVAAETVIVPVEADKLPLVAVTVWPPAMCKVTFTLAVPPLSVVPLGSVAEGSELVNVTELLSVVTTLPN